MPPAADPPIGDGRAPQGWQQVETLGVTEVVMSILNARNAMPSATAATVSRERHGDAVHVRVSLTDDPGQDDPMVIADFIAGRLGQDLSDAFAGNDVFVLE
jgi:hypothetical protein